MNNERIEVHKRPAAVLIKMQLSAYVTAEKIGNWHEAWCPALGIGTQGETLQQARANIEEAVELFIETAFARGTLKKVLAARGFHPHREKMEKMPKPRKIKLPDNAQCFVLPTEIPLMACS